MGFTAAGDYRLDLGYGTCITVPVSGRDLRFSPPDRVDEFLRPAMTVEHPLLENLVW